MRHSGAAEALTEIPSGSAYELHALPIALPSGKAVLSIAQSIDLGLWPDEAFFIKHRRATASVSMVDTSGIYSRSELPTPGPVTSSSLMPGRP